MKIRATCKIFVWVLAPLVLSGCAGFGPTTISHDRFDYAEAISKSWKSQMLLNMVKIRYADVPVFVDVTSVISSYTLAIDVPEVHMAEGRSYETILDQMDVSAEFGPLIEINSDESKPRDDYVAVQYHDYWFWIDDRDLRSKRMFSFLLLLFAFTEKESAIAPLVTIPTG
jgi:hypothetical protein